jgi:hypothetical protein
MLSQIEPVFVLQLLQGFAGKAVPSFMTGNHFFRSLRATTAPYHKTSNRCRSERVVALHASFPCDDDDGQKTEAVSPKQ